MERWTQIHAKIAVVFLKKHATLISQETKRLVDPPLWRMGQRFPGHGRREDARKHKLVYKAPVVYLVCMFPTLVQVCLCSHCQMLQPFILVFSVCGILDLCCAF